MKILIEKLTFNCIIGILDFERKTPQKVIVDLSFKYNYKNNFIDYSQISKKIEDIMKREKFELLEDAIICIEQYLYKKYKIKKLKLKISKPDILTNCIVSLKNR